MKRRLFVFTIAAALGLFAPFASAYYSHNYGNYNGVTVKFNQVTETTVTDNNALYNTPSVYQDSLQFNSLLFASFSQNGASDITDGTLETTIEAKPNAYIDAIKFDEWGDTSLSGTGTSSTYSSIGNSLLIKIREIDGNAIDPCTFAVDMVFSPQDSWNLADDGAVTGADFAGTLTFDVTAAIRSIGYSTGLVTLLDLTMDNTLNTGSETGTNSLILKKETDGLRVTPIIVPEPTTLLLLGLGGLLLRRRK